MDGRDWLAESFEAHRGSLRAVAYRMLGSLSEADDAVQEAWLRFSRSDTHDVENLGGWLTTVVARVCLDVLRSRAARREEPLGSTAEATAPTEDGTDPEHEAMLADAVGLALLVVLERLTPAERIAFVLHDLFAVPFAEIAPVVGRSPTATKKLASRARHRVRGAAPAPDADLVRRARVVDAFLAASREGDLDALLAVLDSDVVRRADRLAIPADATAEVRGARAVAEETLVLSGQARLARPALVDGAPGLVVAPGGRLRLALSLTIEGEQIVEIDVVADPGRLRRLDLAVPTEPMP